jgi:hypothetical protein
MADTDSKWDRQELYENVWRRPLSELAKEYGVSDVALGKVCRKLQIPLPGSGYWTKAQFGKIVTKPALPEVSDLPVLLRQPIRPKSSLLIADAPELEPAHRIETSPIPPATKAMLNHPLIENARRKFSGAQTTDRGVLWPGHEADCLDIRVSKACMPRALLIVATVIHVLENEGFALRVEKRRSESTSVTIHGEEIRFGVVERSRQIKHANTGNAKGEISTAHVYNSIKLEPTGRLSIEIWTYSNSGLQRVWRDGDRASLEQQIPKCIGGMIRLAVYAKEQREIRAKQDTEKQKQIDEIEDELKRIQEEESRISLLRRDAAAWGKSEQIRRYIAAVKNDVNRKPDSSEKTKTLEWIEWAERQADRIDPLKKSPDSIVDKKEQCTRRIAAIRWHW